MCFPVSASDVKPLRLDLMGDRIRYQSPTSSPKLGSNISSRHPKQGQRSHIPFFLIRSSEIDYVAPGSVPLPPREIAISSLWAEPSPAQNCAPRENLFHAESDESSLLSADGKIGTVGSRSDLSRCKCELSGRFQCDTSVMSHAVPETRFNWSIVSA